MCVLRWVLNWSPWTILTTYMIYNCLEPNAESPLDRQLSRSDLGTPTRGSRVSCPTCVTSFAFITLRFFSPVVSVLSLPTHTLIRPTTSTTTPSWSPTATCWCGWLADRSFGSSTRSLIIAAEVVSLSHLSLHSARLSLPNKLTFAVFRYGGMENHTGGKAMEEVVGKNWREKIWKETIAHRRNSRRSLRCSVVHFLFLGFCHCFLSRVSSSVAFEEFCGAGVFRWFLFSTRFVSYRIVSYCFGCGGAMFVPATIPFSHFDCVCLKLTFPNNKLKNYTFLPTVLFGFSFIFLTPRTLKTKKKNLKEKTNKHSPNHNFKMLTPATRILCK